MDTRIKKFLNRRSRSTASSSGLEHPSISQQFAPASYRPSIFLYQSRAKSTSDAQKELENHATYVRSFSYDSVPAGKAPTIGTIPQKGNGPVRLQASRRLSSGDLTVTSQDPQRTLQDIRKGDYIVGKKERPMSRNQGTPRASTTDSRLFTHQSSPATSAHSHPQTWPSTPKPETQSVQHTFQMRNPEVTSTNIGLGLSPPSFTNLPRQSYDSQRSAWSHHSASRGSSASLQATLHSRPQDNNATLEALRRAEYGRLVELYGQEGAARQLAMSEHQHQYHRNASVATSPAQPSSSSFVLDLPPAPALDGQEVYQPRMSGTSVSDNGFDTWSGTSSPHRASLVSSHADPSISTAHTSLVEEETTGDDIRKLVAQIRSTYLDALEAHSMPPAKAKPRKKKVRKSKQTPSSIIPGESPTPKTTPPSTPGRPIWHADNHFPDSSAKRRMNSESAGPVGRLSPIQASPLRGEDETIGIKRADSTTLGGIMAELTRSKIRSREASRTVSPSPEHRIRQPVVTAIKDDFGHTRPTVAKGQPQTNQDSWLDMESQLAKEVLDKSLQEHPKTQYQAPIIPSKTPNINCVSSPTSQAPDKFESLYQDLFGKDADDLWSSPSSVHGKDFAPLVRLTYTGDKGSGFTPRSSQSRKPSSMSSIVQIPENSTVHTHTYTYSTGTTARLSGTVKPPGNFF
ncbi:hypothetical protein H2198_004905 [Neophaeococcomyces mojaviensis]|uniref:Uncharacterized protein n=1 Tax=Neophaeococcomyces mojaviensis TaxID=3383035 RepID=A0ACC3A7B3_9EURO|nr:hypothetical protein H2198_004905 [Knufia sp. JES_112]